MPGYVKIGVTDSIENRMRSLDNTSVALPFSCFFAAEVENTEFIERHLHDAFGDHRVRSSREFFRIAPERVVAAIQIAKHKEITPQKDFVETKEDQRVLEEARKKRTAFNFKMIDIPAGAELKFIRDESVTCVVATDQKHVVYKGREMSSSEAAAEVLGSKWWPAGSDYWTYEDETLDERRTRMEEGGGET